MTARQQKAIKDLVSIIHGSSNRSMPFRLTLTLDKVASDGTSRYFKVYVDEIDVTALVAEIASYRLSAARNTTGDIIVHGCGMDMAFSVVHTVGGYVNQLFPDLIDDQYYNYRSKLKHK